MVQLLSDSESLLSWTSPYQILDGHAWIKIFLAVFNTANIILGVFCYVVYYSFERHGGDPQKRGLLNQIVSQTVATVGTTYGTMTALNTVWIMLGSTESNWFFWIWYVANFYRSYVLPLYGFAYYGTKFIFVVVTKRVLPIMDDFIALFVMLAIMSLALMLILVHSFTTEALQIYAIMSGHPRFIASVSPVNWKIKKTLLVAMIPLMIFVNVKIFWERRKVASTSIPLEGNCNNVTTHNPDIMSCGLAVVLSISLLISTGLKMYDRDGLALIITQVETFTAFNAIPALVICSNPEFRRFAAEFYNLN